MSRACLFDLDRRSEPEPTLQHELAHKQCSITCKSLPSVLEPQQQSDFPFTAQAHVLNSVFPISGARHEPHVH